MTNPHLDNEHGNQHEAGIRTPKQLIAAITAAFLIPIACIVLLVQYVTNTQNSGAGSNAQSNESVVTRIRPVGDQRFTLRDMNAPRILQTGVEVYKAVCSACHTAGAAGAPKLGDTAAWRTRLTQGYETLVTHAVGGIRAMPAKGGNPDLDDVEVARAVAYIGNQAGAAFTEPAGKAAEPVPTGTMQQAPQASLPVAASAPALTRNPPAMAPLSPALASAPSASVDAGKKLYDGVCQTCHAAGVAGAPKFGDKSAWAARLKQGTPVLYTHAINGYQGKSGVMPPKGGSAATDDEVKAAVDYMSAAAK
ncbi:MAG: c-type cytochrome [Burkholderiaceae bacterium]